ncbi:MAG: DUF4157 domain-containing protein [Moorea sp. SIO3C2]|nr:DUF4157 domain-containing protein [Moorena sp. SIO3C2]
MGNQRQSQTKTTQARDQSIVSGSRNPTLHPMEELQGIIGNRALGQLIKSQPQKYGQVHRAKDSLLSSVSPVSEQPIQGMPMFRGLSHELRGNWQQGNLVQAKLTIGEAGDKYEQEADRVASEVVRQINAPVPSLSTQPDSIQAQQEQDQLMRKPMVQLQSVEGGMAVTPELESTINRARGGGQPLDAGLQRSMGQALGADLSGVKIHTDAQADQLNQSIQAKAFTTGQDVFFRQGAYDPGSRGGQELIAHEMTHVVQQEPNLREGSGKDGNQRPVSNISTGAPRTGQANEKVQRKFVGSLGEVMESAFDPKVLGVTDTWYDIVYNNLKNSKKELRCEEGEAVRFNFVTNTLEIRRNLYREILKLNKKRREKSKEWTKQDEALFAEHISKLTHELSHAEDILLYEKEIPTPLKQRTMAVLETEVRAWAREASQLGKQLNKDYSRLSSTLQSLIYGWKTFKRSDLESVNEHKKDSELHRRLFDYIRREIKATETLDVDRFVKENEEKIYELMDMKQRSVLPYI